MNKKRKQLKTYLRKNSLFKSKQTYFRTMEESNNKIKNKTNYKKKMYTDLSIISKLIIQWIETT